MATSAAPFMADILSKFRYGPETRVVTYEPLALSLLFCPFPRQRTINEH
jgi:hypothetical protein